MAKSIYDHHITLTETGATIPNATVSVNIAGGGIALLFYDRAGSNPAPNPFTADSKGRVQFYLDAGRYDMQASYGGGVIDYPDVVVSSDEPLGVNVTPYDPIVQYTDVNDWVVFNDTTYSPIPSELPIGPEPFDSGKWYFSQGEISADNVDLTVNSLSRASVQSYLENAQVQDYATLIANAAQYADGDVVEVTNTGIAGTGTIVVSVAHGYTSTKGVIVALSADKYWRRNEVMSLDLRWFGGIDGSDTANAAVNAQALYDAVTYCNDAKGGNIDLGVGEWVFGAVNFDAKFYFTIWGNQTKVRITGEVTFTDCGFFTVWGWEVTPTVSHAHDIFVLAASAGRNSRFTFGGGMNIGLGDVGIHATGPVSQGWIENCQFGNSNKSIYFESGFTADHIVLDKLIFGDHDVGQRAVDMRCNNWALTNSHFETNHDSTTTYDIYAGGQNYRVQNNTMTQSGGIILNSTNGTCSNNEINRCTTLIAIDAQVGENSVNNNDIKWDTNTSAGRYDGTGKTGIKLTSATSCDSNNVKRSDIAFDNYVSNFDMVGNKVNDAITSGIQTGNNTNVTITGGSIFVGKATAAAVSQTSGNGDGCFMSSVNFVLTGGAVRTSGLGSRFVLDITGAGSPEGLEFGGPGSTYRNYSGSVMGALYKKDTSGTQSTGWRRLDIPVQTSAELDNIADVVNTQDKFDGVQVFNTTTNRPVWATGTTAGAVWVDATGATAHTPV